MIESILDTIKKLLGIPSTDTAFDGDIIVAINSAIGTLHQVGVGPATPVLVTDSTAVWADLTIDPAIQSLIESYIYMSAKLVFDPPGTSFGIESFKNMLQELIWRIAIVADPPPTV
jgi:hypothetical protein